MFTKRITNKEEDTNLYDKNRPTMIRDKDEKFKSKRRKEQKKNTLVLHIQFSSRVSTGQFFTC